MICFLDFTLKMRRLGIRETHSIKKKLQMNQILPVKHNFEVGIITRYRGIIVHIFNNDNYGSIRKQGRVSSVSSLDS